MAKLKVHSPASKTATHKPSRAAARTPNPAPARPSRQAADKTVNDPVANGVQGSSVAGAANHIQPLKRGGATEVAEKVKELVRLAQEQGYLTYGDINDALPDNLISAEELDDIYVKLRNLEIEIVDQAEVDRVKQPEPEEEEDKTRLDILDDPVRMYLKQMGQVPLLSREQEVAISKRIEDAENEIKRIIYSFGFAGKEHIAVAEKLVSEPPKERFDRVIIDKKIDSRDTHLRALRKLIKLVRALDRQVDEKYAAWQNTAVKTKRHRPVAGAPSLETAAQ